MADGVTITVDTAGLLAALDAVGDLIEAYTMPVAKQAAERIAADARARVARSTGETRSGIHVERSHDGKGYVVMAYDVNRGQPPVDYWLEEGTRFMTAKPFFYASASLEEGAYRRAVAEAIQQAIAEVGLGVS